MADMYNEVESEVARSKAECESSSRVARRRRIKIRRFKYLGGPSLAVTRNDAHNIERKLKKVEGFQDDALEKHHTDENGNGLEAEILVGIPKFGMTSVCGRRREMEDAVAICPSFCIQRPELTSDFHYFAVYDGHGCSHVAERCRERLHELVREEVELLAKSTAGPVEWGDAMRRSFMKMDNEVTSWKEVIAAAAVGEGSGSSCKCKMQSPECDAVGSTAVVAVLTPDKIIVANCGDSRAVLCRKGKAVPLSVDHKPDRPDELDRIQMAGGKVVYRNGARVFGILAMSRAIGDNYLKPYVSCEPEVTIMDRTLEDDCLILASDGLWDVVSNETACKVARMCLRVKARAAPRAKEAATPLLQMGDSGGGIVFNDSCSDASMALTKLAFVRQTADNVSVVVVDLK
ncbi:hypothetical protein SAY86_017010 [Trapa natans]|uniref:protein-serine/threonine phosphatase n=1 Tax=Trapa natans TaxID=22666 RepID=A0AAN7R704_TRANT|nr:hypothetical protein SAY86_017010 [Trapa natans]